MAPDQLIVLPDGRRLASDDLGAPDGTPVVYLHGTPDSRLARHPDDALATACGVRLLAVDRPGAGDSDPHPAGSLASLGDDLGHLLDALALDRVALLGWSSGGLCALAVASVLGDRVRTVTLVAPVPPVEAYADAALVAALGPHRQPFAELATELAPAELAAEVAPYLVPEPLTPALALDHVLESAGPQGRAELGSVPGAAEQLAAALVASIQGGSSGLAHDLVRQLEPGLDLRGVRCPVHSIHGTNDPVSPPEVGAWLAAHLPEVTVEIVPEAGHHLVFPRWPAILQTLGAGVANR